MRSDIKPWNVLSSEYVMQDKFMTLRTDRCEREDGHVVPRYHVIELLHWVTVIPITEAGNIILVREYRHAAGKVMIGLPGGTSDPGETDLEQVGRRELAEETGCTPREMHLIGSCFPNPAVQDNEIHYFLALGCDRVADQSLDPNEEIEVVEMSLRDFLAYETLDVQHALHAAALFYLQQFVKKHPELLPSGTQA